MKPFLGCLAAVALAGCFAAPGNTGGVSDPIGPSGGQLTSADGLLTLDIPAGALDATTTITISAATGGQLPADVVAIGGAYAIGPAPLHFKTPVQVSISVPDGALGGSGEFAIVEVPAGDSAPITLASAHTDAAISSPLSDTGTVQVEQFILVSSDSTGGTSGISGGSNGSTGGTTGTGSSGTTGLCGGAASGSSAGDAPEQCQLIAQSCDGTSQYEVDCFQGNCRCLVRGQERAWVQEPTNDCGSAWSDCGFPPSPGTGTGTGASSTTGGSPGGFATVTGSADFSSSANGYTLSNNGGTTEMKLTLAQNGLCGGIDATGLSVTIGVSNPGQVFPQTYAAAGQGSNLPAIVTVSDWDDDAGVYGVIGTSVDGGVIITGLDGGLASGSFDVNIAPASGALTHVSGTFNSVPLCGP